MESDDVFEYATRHWVKAKLTHVLEMSYYYTSHEILWDVPCGPTLAMVEKPEELTGFERYLRGRNA